jgi:hypothetical protein
LLNTYFQAFGRRVALAIHNKQGAGALRILEELGTDGMSSEESDGGGANEKRSFNIKTLPWRNASLTAWLHSIDKLPLVNAEGVVLPRRANWRERALSHIVSANRPAPKGLPKAFYNLDWLRRQGVGIEDQLRMKEGGNIPGAYKT